MSVIGFDVGNDNCVIAVVKQRGIDVLLNDESERETPAVVSFGDKQRFLGAAGAASASMKPRSTVSQIKRLVGRSFSSASDDLRRLPFPTSESNDGGILVHLPCLNSRRAFTPVQILAMLLAHLKGIAEKDLAIPVSDCVIGIPSYFTDHQRHAYLDAAAIAGLNPLRLMHDTAATALGYGIYKTDAGAPINVVFVDIGHCDTQVSVVYFMSGGMRVLSHASDPNLGSRDFDEVLFNYFSEQFKEQYKIDASSNARASIRLRVACEKLKKVLSANAEAPLNIECLMDEKDLRGLIKRDEFERLSSDLLEKVLMPCKKAMRHAGLGMNHIHSVELVGSGSRIPAISRILGGFFRRELSRTLNASECVARGCALQCAMLSPIFRVREYEMQDSFPFSVGLSSDEGRVSILSSDILFRKGELFPSVKMLIFHRFSTFQLGAFYADQSELPPGTAPKMSSFTVGPFPVSQGESPKVKVKLWLNLHGIVSVESAWVDGRGGVPVTAIIYSGMTKDMLLEAQEAEQELANQDKLMEQTKDKKNALESYVYEIRKKLLERYRSFVTESEREGLYVSLQQTEDWLYEDGDDETEKVYASKMDELKKLVDPIERRFKDEEAQAQAIHELLQCIAYYMKAAKSMATYERDAVTNECSKTEQWLRERFQQQNSSAENADPVLWSHEIKGRTEALDIYCRNIMSSPSRAENATVSDHSNTPNYMQTE